MITRKHHSGTGPNSGNVPNFKSNLASSNHILRNLQNILMHLLVYCNNCLYIIIISPDKKGTTRRVIAFIDLSIEESYTEFVTISRFRYRNSKYRIHRKNLSNVVFSTF